jgi:hypothetical protein
VNTRSKRSIGAAVLCTALFGTSSLLSSDEDKPKPAVVSVIEIGSKVTLIGHLGQPLGTMVDVTGTWDYPDETAKDYSLRFKISHVNSKRLDRSVELNVAQVNAVTRDGKEAIPDRANHKQLAGVSWTLRAFETGRFHVTPDEYLKETGQRISAAPYWWDTFESELVGIVRERAVPQP